MFQPTRADALLVVKQDWRRRVGATQSSLTLVEFFEDLISFRIRDADRRPHKVVTVRSGDNKGLFKRGTDLKPSFSGFHQEFPD
jgi:hypothetical protein